MAIQIGITDYMKAPATEEQRAYPGAKFVFLDEDFSSDALKSLDALLLYRLPITADTVSKLNNCRIIVRYGVGYEKLDLAACRRAGIPVCNTPDYGTEEVADTAAAMILSLTRKTHSYDRHARFYASGWQQNIEAPICRNRKSTLGVIGVGRIGTALMLRMKPFGFSLLGYDPYLPSGHEKAIGYRRCHSLDELLAESDIVSLHCPEKEETRGMINSNFFSQMKDASILVNTARGGLLESLDLLRDALASDKLQATALDVLPQEPPDKTHPLIQAWREDADWLSGRLIITPHTAYYSDQSIREMRYKAAETLRLYFEEGRIRNRVD